MIFIIAIIFVILCFVIAGAASNRGRSGFGWFFLSLILSPLIAAVLLLLLGPTNQGSAQGKADGNERWNTLVNFDPDISSAVHDLAQNGRPAVLAFRTIYQEVADKSAIPSIVGKILQASPEELMTLTKLPIYDSCKGVPIYLDRSDNTLFVNGKEFRVLDEAKRHIKEMKRQNRS